MKDLNFKNPLTWFAVGFGSGLSPLAPGTLASFIAGLIFYFLSVLESRRNCHAIIHRSMKIRSNLQIFMLI